MLKAALEALKKNEQKQQAALATQSVPSKHGLDSDEEDVLNLLDEINTIQPTFTSTKAVKLEEEQRHSPAPSSSSDLFNCMDMEDLESSLPATTEPAPSMGPMTIASRPFVGASPTVIAPVVPVIPASADHLPFPINPDGFSESAFVSNLEALSRLFTDVNLDTHMPISQIPSLDKYAKIPLVIGMIVAIDQPTGRDFLVSLADDTGTIMVTVHETVPRESRKRLHYGMMMVLGDVSVYRPTPKAQCLIVVPRNVKYLVSNTHIAL